MAIEAARQTICEGTVIRGFEIHDVTFQKSLFIPKDSPGVEVTFTLRRLKAAPDVLSSSSEWILSMYENNQWFENCRGTINVERESDYQGSSNSEEIACEAYTFSHNIKLASKNCTTPLESETMYQWLRDCGLEYGPTFTLLNSTFSDNKNSAISKVKLYQDTIDPKLATESDYVIHPTTLDAFFHLIYVGLTSGCTQWIPTSVPTSIRRLWVSAEGLKYPRATELVAYSQLSRLSSLLYQSSLVAMSAVDGVLRIVAEGVETTSVAMTRSPSQTASSDIQRYHRLGWKPDLSLLGNTQVLEYVRQGSAKSYEPKAFYEKLTLLLLMFIHNTLNKMSDAEMSLLDEHHRKYVKWMKMIERRFQEGTLLDASESWKALLSDSKYQHELCTEIKDSSAEGKLFVEVGNNLPAILQGKRDIHEVMFQDGLAESYYQEVYSVPSLKNSYMAYLDALAHKYPTMRILEVGVGTGSATVATLQALSCSMGETRLAPRYAQYNFTDISPSFFEKARQRFPDHASRMKFKLFNVSNDPVEQGFELGTYDLIIAFGSIHITKDLSKSIRNIRKLLKR